MPHSGKSRGGVGMSRKSRRAICAVVAVCVGLLCLVAALEWTGGFVGLRWDGRQVEASQERGNAVVDALEAYRARFGEYPGSLAELATIQSTPILPPTTGDRKWHYVAGADRRTFRLRFRAGWMGYPVSGTDQRWRGRWWLDQ